MATALKQQASREFADEYFDRPLGGVPQIRFGDVWEPTVREGDHVIVYHEGKRFQIVSVMGYWDSRVVEMYERPL